mmetsp:Transcript_9840/g.30982  ORF Transcript_9840/g.30982 Transcript_9840/m.30982 type:complete len:299 (+) Transcript_9840:195-1091(+)
MLPTRTYCSCWLSTCSASWIFSSSAAWSSSRLMSSDTSMPSSSMPVILPARSGSRSSMRGYRRSPSAFLACVSGMLASSRARSLPDGCAAATGTGAAPAPPTAAGGTAPAPAGPVGPAMPGTGCMPGCIMGGMPMRCCCAAIIMDCIMDGCMACMAAMKGTPMGAPPEGPAMLRALGVMRKPRWPWPASPPRRPPDEGGAPPRRMPCPCGMACCCCCCCMKAKNCICMAITSCGRMPRSMGGTACMRICCCLRRAISCARRSLGCHSCTYMGLPSSALGFMCMAPMAFCASSGVPNST